jgi:hypothetical protein
MSGYDLATKDIGDLRTDTVQPDSGDLYMRWNAGAQRVDKIDATDLDALFGIDATVAEINMAADSSANTEVVTTTNVITAAESGSTFILNSATAFVSTLPAKAAGLRFTFYAGATQVTGGNHTVVPNASDDNTIYGEYLVAGVTVPASAEGSINWVADTILPGDRVELFNDGTNWYVSGAAAASGAITFTT